MDGQGSADSSCHGLGLLWFCTARLLLLVRRFFVCVTIAVPPAGGAGAIRTGLVRGCVTIAARVERVRFVGDMGCVFAAAALSNSTIAS